MANPLMILELANIFAGLVDPGASNHLVVQDLKLPAIEENYVDFAAGGAPVQIEIPTYINRLESTFTLIGFVPQVMTMIGLTVRSSQVFSAFGLVRDRLTGDAYQVRAVMTGRLGRVNPSNFRRGDLFSHEYSIRGITRYILDVGDPSSPESIYKWDFYELMKVIGGVDANADLNAMLLTGASGSPGTVAG